MWGPPQEGDWHECRMCFVFFCVHWDFSLDSAELCSLEGPTSTVARATLHRCCLGVAGRGDGGKRGQRRPRVSGAKNRDPRGL